MQTRCFIWMMRSEPVLEHLNYGWVWSLAFRWAGFTTMVDDFTRRIMLFVWHIWIWCNNKRSGRWDPEIPITVVLNNAVLRRSWERPNGTCPQWTRTFSGSKNKQSNGGISFIPVSSSSFPEPDTLSIHWKQSQCVLNSDSDCGYCCHVFSCWDCADGNRTHSLRTDVWVTWVTVLRNSWCYYCRARPSQKLIRQVKKRMKR